MASKTFKLDRETGMTITTFDGVSIRIDAGESYTTENPREIEILQETGGVLEVKKAAAKKKDD